MDRLKVLQAAETAALKAREILLHHYGRLTQVEEKESAGVVTEADLEAEKIITETLLDLFPGTKVIGEESSFKSGHSAFDNFDPISTEHGTWIVDPLDGTSNYVHGFHIFCCSIGFEYQGQIIAGVIDVPALNATYKATRGGGAFKNANPIRVSQRDHLSKSMLGTGFPIHKKQVLGEQIQRLLRVADQVRAIRRPGAAAYDLCMVAEGIYDGFWEVSLSPWDLAAGSLLVEEAGGKISRLDKSPYQTHDSEILATNGHIHDSLARLLS